MTPEQKAEAEKVARRFVSWDADVSNLSSAILTFAKKYAEHFEKVARLRGQIAVLREQTFYQDYDISLRLRGAEAELAACLEWARAQGEPR